MNYVPPTVGENTGGNTSGMGPNAIVPPEIQGWNWGAFFLNWIWSIGNQVWIGLLSLVLGIIMSIILGVKGNEWAWRNRKWESVEEFKRVQRVWAIWGLVVFLVGLVFMVIYVIAMVAFIAAAGSHGSRPY